MFSALEVICTCLTFTRVFSKDFYSPIGYEALNVLIVTSNHYFQETIS